jgi:hypothetical protein
MSVSGAWEQGVELAQAFAIGDTEATRILVADTEDWRPGAMWLAQALVQAIGKAGIDPVAYLARYAQSHGTSDALDRDIARGYERNPPTREELREAWPELWNDDETDDDASGA